MEQIYIDILLEKYFFSKEHYTSCTVILTKLYKNSIEQYFIVEEQMKDSENNDIEKFASNGDNESKDNTTLSNSHFGTYFILSYETM